MDQQKTEPILIITYYWPPAGGPGVQRWLKFSKYLPEFGIHPHVYTPKNPEFSLRDESLVNEIPKDITIIKRKIIEPYGLAQLFNKTNKDHAAGFFNEYKPSGIKSRISLFIRGNFFIPDARFLWIIPSVIFLKKYIKEHQIKTIITTGPPHSMHMIGFLLKKQIKTLQWIADFRDPWTTIYYYKHLRLTKWADTLHKSLEKKVLHWADKIITVNHTYQKLYKNLTTKPVFCITNGYDSIELPKKTILDSCFSIAYIGAMFQDRNPKLLWKVLHELCETVHGFKDQLSIKLIGKIDPEIINEINENLALNLNHKGYIPHAKAIEEQCRSQILLIITTDSSELKGNVPGKLFEYMASKRPIYAFGPDQSEIATIIQNCNAGFSFLFNDYEKLKQQILKDFYDFRKNQLICHSKKWTQYHRKNLTKVLVKVIKEA